ncbi:NusA-like transcription termination signal-binding factor [Candidatus Woesearchaeota archaeon]|nr:NusA-like transcription termination signal-binding factor [Candidatus Woesearchaeota archaeon]
MRIKYDGQILSAMKHFEKLTRTRLKDCFEDKFDKLVFIVMPGEILKAIGKKAVNVKKLEESLKRKIRIIEFATDIESFLKNTTFPTKISSIERLDDEIIEIVAVDSKSRGILIGRNAQNLRNIEAIIKRYYPLGELKVK